MPARGSPGTNTGRRPTAARTGRLPLPVPRSGSPPRARRWFASAPSTPPASVRVEAGHRAHRPHRADRTVGRGGSASWQSVGQITITGSALDRRTGVRGRGYQYRTSTDGGASWSGATAGASVDGDGKGRDARPVPGGRRLRAALGMGAGRRRRGGDGAHRPRRSDGALAAARTHGRAWPGHGHRPRGRPTRPLAVLAGYEYRSRPTAARHGRRASAEPRGGRAAEGRDDGAVPQVAGTRGWTPAASSATRPRCGIDRTAPSDPGVVGGSLAWQSVASVAVSASRLDGQRRLRAGKLEHRTSTDGGVTWSAATAGAPMTVSARARRSCAPGPSTGPGTTRRGRRPWAPQHCRASTARRPSTPSVGGGSLGLADRRPRSGDLGIGGRPTAAAAGSSRYEYRTRPNGGETWSVAAAGACGERSRPRETTLVAVPRGGRRGQRARRGRPSHRPPAAP